MLKAALDSYDIADIDYVAIDMIDILRPYQHKLGLQNLSLNEMLWELNCEKRNQDTCINVVNMRTCLYNAANRLTDDVTDVKQLIGVDEYY